jgi:RNA polymerase sigma-70 factor (ECF subfamily)
MTGNPGDWTTWLRERGPALVLWARQWAPEQADAEDIVQEAFVRFWRSRHKAVDPVAYLYTCVRHYALEWRRSQQRRTRREEAVARPEQTGAGGWFVCRLEHDERRNLIEAALKQLPDPQRQVMVLKIWGGLSFRQMAETLGISENTAASRYRYALSKLREQLAEESIS